MFNVRDFRFTVGKNGALYTFCMVVPTSGTALKIKSLGTDAKYLGKLIKSVKLLGYEGKLQWKQEADGLAITCPKEMPFETSVVFKVE
jgi:alpha-L-fucosidase